MSNWEIVAFEHSVWSILHDENSLVVVIDPYNNYIVYILQNSDIYGD